MKKFIALLMAFAFLVVGTTSMAIADLSPNPSNLLKADSGITAFTTANDHSPPSGVSNIYNVSGQFACSWNSNADIGSSMPATNDVISSKKVVNEEYIQPPSNPETMHGALDMNALCPADELKLIIEKGTSKVGPVDNTADIYSDLNGVLGVTIAVYLASCPDDLFTSDDFNPFNHSVATDRQTRLQTTRKSKAGIHFGADNGAFCKMFLMKSHLSDLGRSGIQFGADNCRI